MDHNRGEAGVQARGAETGPLPQLDAPPAGQPTTYVPPEVRPEVRPDGQPGTSYTGYSGPGAGMPPPPSQWVHNDRRARAHAGHGRMPVFGPVLLIAAGTIFLLNNLGVLPWSVWGALGKLWPLILIAIGIDLIVGRRNPLLSGLILLAVLAAGVGFLYANGSFDESIGTAASALLDLPLGSTTSAEVRLELGTGALTVGSLGAGADKLAQGTLQYYSGQDTPSRDVSLGERSSLVVKQSKSFDFFNFHSGSAPRWDVNLNRTVPLDLTVDSGTGSVTLNLENLRLTSLTLDTGTGNAAINLPTTFQGGNVPVNINGGTGNLKLTVPAGVEARISVDHGIGDVQVDKSRFRPQGEDIYVSDGYNTAAGKVDIKIDHGVGNVVVK